MGLKIQVSGKKKKKHKKRNTIDHSWTIIFKNYRENSVTCKNQENIIILSTFSISFCSYFSQFLDNKEK